VGSLKLIYPRSGRRTGFFAWKEQIMATGTKRAPRPAVATVLLPVQQGGGWFLVRTLDAAKRWKRAKGCQVIMHPGHQI
jgi:hypothetical protein